MSNLCKTALCTTVQNVVDSTTYESSVEDILFNSISTDKIQPTNRISKASIDALPNACAVPNGHIVFLDDAKVPVIASNGTWIGLDGRDGTFIETQIWVWGSNSCGQLGSGSLLFRCSPVREICSATDWCKASAGFRNSSAIKTSGELWSWGSNDSGALGDGTVTSRCSPVREICSATDWCQVSVQGCCHTAAIKTSGEIWSWGGNGQGQLAVGNITPSCSPVREFCSSTDWCQVSVGIASSAAIKTSGQLWAWGRNCFGILGDGRITSRCSPVREICSATDWCQVSIQCCHAAAIKTSGQLWSWGSGCYGFLGTGTLSCSCSPVREFCSATDWCQVRAGGLITSAIKTSGQLWTWGRGLCGILGDGTTVNKCSPVREFCSATDWCQVSSGRDHSVAIKTTGQIWSWGVNICGKTGIGTGCGASCSPVREFSSSSNWCMVDAGGYHTVAIKSVTNLCR